MLADTNSGLFTLLMLITAALFGPFVYVCLCIIIIYFLCPTPSSANELQMIELQPTTQVGHSDGFCYLELFSPPHRQSLRASLSCYPTIIELVAIAARGPHGYTTGTIFLTRTRTRIHRTRGGYGYIPTRFWCGVGRNPRYL